MEQALKTFSIDSAAYADARPRYPQHLYAWILSHCSKRNCAWDCATGNGQAAVDLAPHFSRIDASDISVEQIDHALPGNVLYRTGSAEDSGYAGSGFDLITVAQALHWFDFRRFWSEVERVSADGAFFCAWGYSWFTCDPQVDHILVQPLREILEPYWASNNAILWRGYNPEELQLPFEALQPTSFKMHLDWNVSALLRYMQTWSAYKRAASDAAAAHAIRTVLISASKSLDAHQPTATSMPLSVIAGFPKGK